MTMKRVLLLITLALAWNAHSQTLTFNAETVNAVEKVTPVLSWSTEPAATSCTASGAPNWIGTKAASGKETLPAITASQVYTLVCTWPGNIGASIAWTPPTQNTDGSALAICTSDTPTDKACLLKFRLSYGRAADQLTSVKDIGRTVRTWQLPDLSGGTWYFQLKAVNASGVESPGTIVLSKVTGASATVSRSRGITVDPRPADPAFTVQ
jgi:hypothetical protein